MQITLAMFSATREGNYDVIFVKPFASSCYVVTAGTEINTSDNEQAEVVFQVKALRTTGFKLIPQVFYASTDGFKDWSAIYANYIAIGK